MFFPDIHRLFIGVIDRDQQLVAINTEFFGDQIPSKRNSVFFKVIPKAKIAEHFKKGMVTRGIAHIIKVIMFATGAHAFLAGGRTAIIAVFKSGKNIFELDHTGGRKHQGRIITWHEG